MKIYVITAGMHSDRSNEILIVTEDWQTARSVFESADQWDWVYWAVWRGGTVVKHLNKYT